MTFLQFFYGYLIWLIFDLIVFNIVFWKDVEDIGDVLFKNWWFVWFPILNICAGVVCVFMLLAMFLSIKIKRKKV